MDITKFGLQNFRVFKEHFEFDLAPIMVLTGPNSSGKSSLSKALLLLKASQYDLNINSHYSDLKLNYFKGEHDLGNHKLTINDTEKDSLFSLTFFEEYKLIIDVGKNGQFIHDYTIKDEENETVITQLGGIIYIDILKLIKYLKKRIQFLKFKNYTIDYEKVELFIMKFSEFNENTQIFKIDLYLDKEFCNLAIEDDVLTGIDLEEDFYCWESDRENVLIELFRRIVSIELTRDEIRNLIPTSANSYTFDKNVIQFNNLFYINTLKEPLKRIIVMNENSSFYSFINSEIIREDVCSNPLEYQINTNKELETPCYFEKGTIRGGDFIKKWLVEFEIGSELVYGYNEEHDFYYLKIDNKSLPEVGLGNGLIIRLLLELIKVNENMNLNQSDEQLIIAFPRTCIIEEPEMGLHPAFQSKIAEMLVDFQQTYKINLIIETHSEYFIRKLQYLTAKQTLTPGDAVIYYFNNPKKIPVGEEQIKKITIEKDGSLTDNFGPGFIDEGTNLKFELLRLNKSRQN
jgi:AAA15 family ATPase/GTPase